MPFGSFKIKRNTFKVLFFILLTSCLSYSQDSLNYYNTKISKLYAQGNKSQSDAVFQQKSSYLKRQNNAEEYLYAWWEYFMLEPVEERLYLLKNALKSTWRPEKNEAEKVAKLHVMINLAYHQKSFGNIYQSIQSYEKAMYFFDQNHINNYDIIDYALKPLANNCTRIGDYDRAEELLVKTLKLTELPENKTKRAGSVLNLSIFYNSVGKYKEAILLIQDELKNPKLSNYQQAGLNSELSRNYLDENQTTEARKFAEFSNSLLKSESKNTTAKPILLRNELTLGKIYASEKQFDKSLTHYDIALKSALELYGRYDRETSKIYVLKAQVFHAKNDLQAALQNLQKAQTGLLPSFNPISIHTLPTLEMLYPENTFLDIFDLFSQIQNEKGNHELAIQALELTFQTNEQLRFTYAFQNAKLLLQSQNSKRTEQYLDACYKLYEQTQNAIWVEKAFFMVERNKASVLADELSLKFQKSSYTHDTLIKRERELQLLKAELNTELALLGPNTLPENKKKKEALLIQSEKLSREWIVIQNQIGEKYPDVATRKSLDWNMQSIQKSILKNNSQLIEFFVGSEVTYVFSLSKSQTLRFRKLLNTSYENELIQYLAYYQPENKGKMQIDFTHFNELAYTLYKVFLAEELKSSSFQNILLIPDGILSYLPFEALWTQNTSNSKHLYPYLFFEKNISYAYSVGLLWQPNTTQNNHYKSKDAVGFFPIFDQNQRGFSELKFSMKESELISKNQTFKLFTKQEATKTHFIQHASQYPIVHVSTHAQSERDSLPASISFYDETLYLTEIYGYQFPIDILVLSSCETGIGYISDGEGAMSLARGFSYAGVKKLVVSLWEINDQSTALLMGDFYQNLNQNQNVSEALHQAKINYLNNPDIPDYKKTPHYWAGLISITNQMENPNHNFFPLYGLIFIFGLGSVFVLYLFYKMIIN